jgi:hypothetical protein
MPKNLKTQPTQRHSRKEIPEEGDKAIDSITKDTNTSIIKTRAYDSRYMRIEPLKYIPNKDTDLQAALRLSRKLEEHGQTNQQLALASLENEQLYQAYNTLIKNTVHKNDSQTEQDFETLLTIAEADPHFRALRVAISTSFSEYIDFIEPSAEANQLKEYVAKILSNEALLSTVALLYIHGPETCYHLLEATIVMYDLIEYAKKSTDVPEKVKVTISTYEAELLEAIFRHDLGKAALSDGILYCPHRLKGEERTAPLAELSEEKQEDVPTEFLQQSFEEHVHNHPDLSELISKQIGLPENLENEVIQTLVKRHHDLVFTDPNESQELNTLICCMKIADIIAAVTQVRSYSQASIKTKDRITNIVFTEVEVPAAILPPEFYANLVTQLSNSRWERMYCLYALLTQVSERMNDNKIVRSSQLRSAIPSSSLTQARQARTTRTATIKPHSSSLSSTF